ncbi:uncharacterized protein LOC126551455 [Aphis gossypii]|uniref:uncharacterized protein LOC126551455 n=1 Tax=Aphis gossypii TaxID=80765 RepID=UPI00215929AA|nr:uncharacterized protein LOC126551455 [Aphis gossypii]
MQSNVFDLEKELAKRTSVMHVQQEQSQAPVLVIEGGSSTSLMLYQCNLSQTGDEHGASFLDLGRGDDQSTSCLLSIKSSGCTAAEDMTQSSSQSTNDDSRQPSCLLSCSQSSTAQEECSSETTAEPSLAEFRLNRLSYIIKKYESKHEDIS